MSICLARTTSTQQPNMPKSCIRATLHSVKLFTELCLAHAHNNFLVTDLRRKIAIAIKLMKMKMKKLCIISLREHPANSERFSRGIWQLERSTIARRR